MLKSLVRKAAVVCMAGAACFMTTEPSQAAPSRPEVTLWEHANFMGRSLNTASDILNLGPNFGFNDITSSLQTGSTRVTLFDDSNFLGDSIVFQANSAINDLSDTGLNDRISSVDIFGV